MSWIKERLIGVFAIASLTFLLLLILNFVLVWMSPSLMRQPNFPRIWLNFVDPCYQTFYPTTNDGTFRNYVAVVGDSYGAGAGDEFLDGLENYGVFHKLRSLDSKNYLIFARGGFGSINAVKELVFCGKTIQKFPLFPRLEPPAEILVMFYEGNDLNNNIDHIRKRGSNEAIRNFVEGEIAGPQNWVRIIRIYLPLFEIICRSSINAALSFKAWATMAVENSGFDSFGYSSQKSVGNDSFITANDGHRNQIILGNSLYEIPLNPQGAATGLEGNLDQALEVFYKSISVLSETYSNAPIKIVYIPSVVTSYEWSGKISVQTYHNQNEIYIDKEINDRTSLKIRQSIKDFSRTNSYGFVDATESIQGLARRVLIHGPKDWKHFNSAGYQSLVETIFDN